MTDNPVHPVERRLGAEFIPYGGSEHAVEIAAAFDAFELEYAAIRRYVGVMHLPQRGILRFTGKDRQDFLHRMVTQDIRGMKGGDTRRSFQLNDKGRIVADIVVHHGDADTWLEMDRFDAEPVRKLLDARLFSEDVTIEDFTPRRVALALHGPAAPALLAAVCDGDASGPVNMPGTHHVLRLAGGALTTVYRWDDCGTTGLRLHVPTEQAAAVYERLLEAAGYEAGAEEDAANAERRRASLRGRPVGWLAYNTARIEAGTAIFHVDFGTDSIPGETGLLDEAVSFTKGCYLGQEIVARMKHLGHPKRLLVGLRLPGEALPVAGAGVFPADDRANVIGAVTSSTPSPLRGGAAIALAVVKWGRHANGTKLLTSADGKPVEAEVVPRRFMD